MNNKSKVRFRIGAICLIALFLLLPLLSSTVAAAFIDTSTSSTNNTPIGPTAAVTPTGAGPFGYPDVGAGTATFNCNWNFVDTKPLGIGSDNMATLTVTYQTGARTSVNTGIIRLAPGGSMSGTLTIVMGYPPGPPTDTWTVKVDALCIDLQTSAIATATNTYTVTCP
jgi:hypothetical protein